MKLNVVDKTGKDVKEITLEKSVFEIVPNENILHQYIRVFRHNQRQGTSSAKTRAEVSGSGKKPWKQKGTGRARVGSKRSPLWRTGGVVHGPKPKSWNLRFPKKMRALAIKSALSMKVSKKSVIVLQNASLKKPKTSDLVNILNKIDAGSRRILLVLNSNDENVLKSAKNISYVNCALVQNLNAHEILLAHKIVFLEEAIEVLNKKYKK